MRTNWPLILVLSLLVLMLAVPLVSAEGVDPPAETEYAPPMRATTLYSSSQSSLGPGPGDSEQTSTHSFPQGFLSPTSTGPEMRTLNFERNASLGSENWNYSLWASGNGDVQITLSVTIDGELIDQAVVDAVNLNQQPQQVLFSGGGLPDVILEGQMLSIQWEVDSNDNPVFDGSTQCTIHWGAPSVPSNLSFSAGMYQMDQPYLEDSGTPFRGDHETYSRSDLVWAVQARWALGPEHFGKGTLMLHLHDADEDVIVLPTESSLDTDGGLYRFEIEELADGVHLSAHVMWNDTAGMDEKTSQRIYLMDEKGPSILSSGLKTTLFVLTIPVLIVIGIWLKGRFTNLVEAGEKSGHGARVKGDLKRLLTATAVLMLGINNALILYSFHTRQLGAAENVVILHLALLAMAFGITGPLWGALADRFGHRRQLMGGAISAAALIMLAFPWLSAEGYIIATTIQVALFSSVRMAVAVGTEWFPEQKGEMIGVIYAVASLASAASSMICSKLYVWLLPSGTNWAIFGIVGFTVPVLVLALLMVMRFEGDEFSWPVWMLRGDAPPIEKPKLSIKEQLSELRGLFKFENRWVLFALLGVILVAIPRGAVVLTALRYLEVVGFDVDFTGLLEAWAVLAVLVLYAIIGKVCDERGPQTVLLWSAATYGMLWSIFSIGLPPMIAVLIFVVPIYPMLLVSNDALMARFTTEKERNRGIGMASLVAFVGQSIGIMAGYFALSFLLERGFSSVDSYEWFYRANVPLWILAIAFTWWLSKAIGSAEKADQPSEG